MAWTLEGTFYENCSCDAICPCTWSNMAQEATNDDCRVALLFDVDTGAVDGVDVGGTTVVMIALTPALMPAGEWKVGLIISDNATDEQVEALSSVFSGVLGGPPAGLAPLIGELLGVERAPVSITVDGTSRHVTVGEALDYHLTKQQSPEGEQVQLTNISVHPGGPTLDVAMIDGAQNNAFGISWSGDGLSGFSNPFSWAA